MKIAIPKERRALEYRVAASPEVVKKLKGLGFDVIVEKDAGLASSITDKEFVEAGATIAPTAKDALAQADIVWKVRAPMTAKEGTDEVALLKEGTLLMASLGAMTNPELLEALAKRKVDAFAMELMPRISRAQSMDVLSSQSNLAGYRAVIDGAAVFNRAFPMMMTAAGTVPPARILVFGAGVAGLQAIATAKRLGGVVMATDVRPATKEQVESLGGKFITVDDEAMKNAETSGGYAKEMGEEFRKKQAAAVLKELVRTDIAITTALIPGRPAPVLITQEMVEQMKPGSVIVDLAVEAGGNCPLSKPDQIVEHKGVKIVGYTNMAARVAADASPLFAKNLFNFVAPHVDKETKALKLNFEDETVAQTCVTKGGKVVLKTAAAPASAPEKKGA
ncbi:Re/Si-specific NAD(P)(+) transhydrogenase subunit alpha [Phaeovibrio sulfidiphilus]|uniref:NAD(P) transhydrogenase subunit alpha part 1 n=1 Tax=Phaeovibrio sulfidiphilus TaxID=1220600 RepID=A0A8J7CW85_9PROT|nr:Re/Si-specific NAD(P)(+) transhydrogenase subunit alpha [Phaeovibrio sulfidiphilus]MBE1237186.1 Re/Si-specific NAD(P)(+) transhydrogenase subunit alpha [Phaeovibrio sulfidiphilus]